LAIEKHSIDGTSAAIWAETANLNYFLKTSLEPDTVGGVENRTKDIPKRTVSRYVNDPNPYEIPAQTGVRYLYDPGRRNGGATPGQEMILADGIQKRSFTYTGSFIDVHAYMVGNAKMDLTLYSAGAGYEITATGGEAVAAKVR
jgi:hypothetical protein